MARGRERKVSEGVAAGDSVMGGRKTGAGWVKHG